MTNNSFNLADNLEGIEKLATLYQGFGGVDITAQCQDWWNVGFACAKHGEGAREAFHMFSNHYPNYTREETDAKFDNFLGTGRGDVNIGSIIKLMQDAGIDVMRELRERGLVEKPRVGRPRKSADGQQQEEKVSATQQWIDFLRSKGEYRYNVVLDKTEHLPNGETEWKELTKVMVNSLYTEFKAGGARYNKADALTALESTVLATLYNPYRDLMESLSQSHPWDQQTDYITLVFVAIIFATPEDRDFCLPLLRKWFIRMVALALGIVDDNQLTPTLVGPQGCRKTVFCRRLMRLLKQYYKVLTPAEKFDKDLLVQMSSYMMVVFDEFEMTRSKSSVIRAIISANGSQVRAAYGFSAENRKRRASFIATTNNENYIADDYGSRRFLTVNVKEVKPEEDCPLPLEQAFAQAYWIATHESADSYQPSAEEWRAIAERNRDHTEPSFCEVVIPLYYRQPTSQEKAVEVSTGDIMMKLPFVPNREWNVANIGKAIKALGLDDNKRRTNHGMLYLLEEINQEERKAMMHSEGAKRYREMMKDCGIEMPKDDTVQNSDPVEQDLPF